jgi:hypothetical protein
MDSTKMGYLAPLVNEVPKENQIRHLIQVARLENQK